MSELRAKETRLLGAGLLEVPSVLSTRGPPSSPAPPLLPTPQGPTSQGSGQSRGQSRGSRPRFHCSYYDMDGHTESRCFQKDRDLRQQKGSTSSGTRASSGSSPATLTEQDIVRLKQLLAASGSSSPGTAGSVTDSFGTARPPSSTQSGTSSWVLDYGASFHMTSYSSILSSLRPLDSPISVLTADGTPLSVSSRGTLSTSSFLCS
jgi:hypothetical protein